MASYNINKNPDRQNNPPADIHNHDVIPLPNQISESLPDFHSEGKRIMSDEADKPKEAKDAFLEKPKDNSSPDKPGSSKWFQSDLPKLQHMFDPKNKPALDEYGGLERLLSEFRVDPAVGLHEDEDRDLEWTDEQTGHVHGPQPFSRRRAYFGENRLPKVKPLSIFQLMWNAMHDKILIMLSVAAIISLAIGLYQDFGPDKKPGEPPTHWIEGFAIVIAVLIVVLVGSINDYQKEKQFRKLNDQKDDREVKLLRDGQTKLVSIFDVQVGDVLLLEPGDVMNVDGVLISAHNLRADESSATGESDLIRKQPYGSDGCKDPFILSGSKINEGVGKCVVTCIGEKSFFGKTMMGLRVETQDTPLQVKLDGLAELIAKLGAAVSLLLLTTLIIIFLVREGLSSDGWPSGRAIFQSIVNIFIQAIIIVVVAVPEGLPLAVTLALAYGTRQMLKDNNLVRVLASCETMGGATTICSDKTGTLTQNKMTVVAGVCGLDIKFSENAGISSLKQSLQTTEKDKQFSAKEYLEILTEGLALNSTAFEQKSTKTGEMEFVGSKTETALIAWAQKMGLTDFQTMRNDAQGGVLQVYPFSSERKSMTTVIKRLSKRNGQQEWVYRIFTKGASEIVMSFCEAVVRSNRTASLGPKSEPIKDRLDFQVEPINADIKAQVDGLILDFANEALRTICIGYRELSEQEMERVLGVPIPKPIKDFGVTTGATSSDQPAEITAAELSPEASARLEKYSQKHLHMLAIVGIEDPLREGVADAVRKCQDAGVFVRMVTGDNLNTAKAIAKKCGIFMKGGVAMEGYKFRTLSEEEMDKVIPKLQVLARSSPTDKQILVGRLKHLGETVAVTGDGTNDGPALKMADVGFSMGIAGTEVAKEASSIVLMDDNFSSIVKAMMWGRSVNDAIKKFLQFQLTVNVSAVLIAFITAVGSPDNSSVLTAVQLLWVNLIMDSFAALALATDPPTEEVLNRYPESKRSPLITIRMMKMIFGQAIYQVTIGLICYYQGPALFRLDTNNKTDMQQNGTFVFNAFVFMQLFNELNCRRIDSHLNVFAGITRNMFFIPIMIFTVVAQIIIIFFGGVAFQTVPLTGPMWAASLVIGAVSLPIGAVIRLLPTWDGCVIGGVPVGVPDNSRVVMTKERLQWQHSIHQVKTQLQVFKALRGTSRMQISSQEFGASQVSTADELLPKQQQQPSDDIKV